jgi:hypothetical protein
MNLLGANRLRICSKQPWMRDGSKRPSLTVSSVRVELRFLQRRDTGLLIEARRQIPRTKQVRHLKTTSSLEAFIKPINHTGYYTYHLA